MNEINGCGAYYTACQRYLPHSITGYQNKKGDNCRQEAVAEGGTMSAALNGDTVALLKECNAGTKMATSSIEQISEYVTTPELKEMLHKYNADHIKLGEKCHELLNEAGKEEKDPHPMAKAMSWLTSEMKLSMGGDEKKAAGILMDGCAMGIKSLSEYLNQYSGASDTAKRICEKLRGLEEDMHEKLEAYV